MLRIFFFFFCILVVSGWLPSDVTRRDTSIAPLTSSNDAQGVRLSNAQSDAPSEAVQAVRITGRVTDRMGVPVPGATVIAVPADGGLAKSTVSRPDGTYEVDGIAEGAYFVDFELTGFDLERRNNVRASTEAPARADAVLDISALCECEIITPKPARRERVGQVLSASGQALPHAVLRIDRPPFEFALADNEGRFAIRLPLDASVPLTVSESGFQSATQQVTGAVVAPIVFSLATADGARLSDIERLRKPCCPGEFFGHGR